MFDPTIAGAAVAALGVSAAALSRLGGKDEQEPHAARPGWLARARARRGVSGGAGSLGVGWASAMRPARLPLPALQLAGYVSGAPGSGKTTFLRRLIEDYDGPAIILDAKASMDLVDGVRDAAGLVWEIGGGLKLDVLDDEPAVLAQQLLEGEIFTDRGQVYRAIAEHAVQRAATVLHWRAEPREPHRILALLSSPDVLASAIAAAMPPADPMGLRWLEELKGATRTIEEAFRTFAERLGTLLDSPAGRSLGTGRDAVSLGDVLASRGKLLIRLDQRYGSIARKIGAWTLVAMLRLAAELRAARWRGSCLFVVDEPRLLGHEGRHLIDVFGTARDAGIGLVVADQGVAGLGGVHPDLPDAVLRLTGWQMVFRQGSPADAEKMSGVLGKVRRPDVAHASNGNTVTRYVLEARVPDWQLMALPTAHGWLRAAPIGLDARELCTQIVVAAPRKRRVKRMLALPAPVTAAPTVTPAGRQQPAALEDVTVPSSDGEALGRAAVLAKLGDPEPDGCRRCRVRHFDADGYPQVWWQPVRGYRAMHRLIATWTHGEHPRWWDVHHSCGHRWCGEASHLVWLTRAQHKALHQANAKAPSHLSERRQQVLELAAAGLSIRQTAARLGVSHETVRRELKAGKEGSV